MKILDRLKFKIGRWALKGISRSYAELSAMGGQMSDWITSGITDDADLQANWFRLVQRSRDLFKENPYMRKLRIDWIANTFGSEGITLQMKIKEESDRVVFAAEEKEWLIAKQRSYNDWRERAMAIKEARGGNFDSPFLRKREFVKIDGCEFDQRDFGMNGHAKAEATIKAGQPDLYANNLIERAWKEWQRRENCTVGKRHTYAQTREQRLFMAGRDGDCFIRHIRGPKAKNRFNYAIQIIAAEWVDHSLNQILPNGNYIKMGIEYDEWGAVAGYHIIKRQPGDWLYNNLAGTSGRWSPGMSHEFIEARDMTHYCNYEDAESGRSAPEITSVIATLRHLDKYGEAELIAARASACKGGHYVATMAGADMRDLADKIEENGEKLTETVEPAMWKTVPYGWDAKEHDPKHPNGNMPAFNKECLRKIAVGVGDQYGTMSGDLSDANYSSMRAGALDVREGWMLKQRLDIDTAEIPIFEAWLEMALAYKAIPLPLAKIEKFNKPKFQGRRWPWVDPLKDAKADQVAIDSVLTSRSRICNENGDDFEEIVEEQAMEAILMAEAGLMVSNAASEPELNATLATDDDEEIEKALVSGKRKRNKARSRASLTT